MTATPFTYHQFCASGHAVDDLRTHHPQEFLDADYPASVAVPGRLYGAEAKLYLEGPSKAGTFLLTIGNFELVSARLEDLEPSLYAYYLAEWVLPHAAEWRDIEAVLASCPPNPFNGTAPFRPKD